MRKLALRSGRHKLYVKKFVLYYNPQINTTTFARKYYNVYYINYIYKSNITLNSKFGLSILVGISEIICLLFF